MFSVGLLLFGDHPDLARRCLGSLARTLPAAGVADLRIGLNAVSAATREVVDTFCRRHLVPSHLYSEVGGRNVGKYPLMRRMFFDADRPPAGRVMWFDDDSYVTATDPAWWGRVGSRLDDAHLVGVRYRLRSPGYRGCQREGIAAQHWFTGQPVAAPYLPTFVTGGWWATHHWLLRRWDYPFPELHHNGGDSILGELCRQQGYRVVEHKADVAVNAGPAGGNSTAKRRGLTTPWPWEVPGADLAHQNFSVSVQSVV